MLCHALLLDDEPFVLTALRRELLRKPDIGHDGLEILSFASPREALAAIAAPEGVIDFAVVDYRMPELDGIRFLTELKRAQPDAIRILLTGNADTETAIKAINEASIDFLIFKPWHEYDLKGRIALALHQHALQRANRERREQTQPPPRPDAYRLMLIDDEREVLNALRREIDVAASANGGTRFSVSCHASAEEALQSAKNACPDLVIADQAMPGMDGTTFFHYLRTLCPNAVRIMISGQANLKILADAINIAGVYHFIRKPWTSGELQATLAQALIYRDILVTSNALAVTKNQAAPCIDS